MKGKKNKKNEKTLEEEENESHEQFLSEIEEYAKKLNEDADKYEDLNTTDSYQEKHELEIDNLHQVIDDLKLQLETEKNKVKDLNESISKKNHLIKSLEDNTSTDNYDREEPTHSKFRYWNWGFCREKGKCQYFHPKEDCRRHIEKGKCENIQCEGRHRKYCRYFNNKSGCYRGDSCQYLHSYSKKV